MDQVFAFCQKNSINFRDLAYMRLALTHSTYAYEHGKQMGHDNERLEFLGDAVLQLSISEALFSLEGEMDEGRMTKYRSLVVCEDTLAQVAHDIALGDYLYLGKGEELTGGRIKPSNLSNALEAVYGAIYLDQGFAYVKQMIVKQLGPYIDLAVSGKLVYDFKSRLLEMAQACKSCSGISFAIIDESGPVHERTFTAAVILDHKELATGQGTSKKEAEQNAAKSALQILTYDDKGSLVVRRVENQEMVGGQCI